MQRILGSAATAPDGAAAEEAGSGVPPCDGAVGADVRADGRDRGLALALPAIITPTTAATARATPITIQSQGTPPEGTSALATVGSAWAEMSSAAPGGEGVLSSGATGSGGGASPDAVAAEAVAVAAPTVRGGAPAAVAGAVPAGEVGLVGARTGRVGEVWICCEGGGEVCHWVEGAGEVWICREGIGEVCNWVEGAGDV